MSVFNFIKLNENLYQEENKMYKIGTAFLFFILLIPALFFISLESSGKVNQPAEGNLIQIALLLDTSNSMDGLINQAKSHLWSIINEASSAKKFGENARIEVALYEYGNNGLPAEEGYIRQVVPLTSDLDIIAEKLFELKTFGGYEYCGQVIKRAVDDLQWNSDKGILKLVFIAGNEPFNQAGSQNSGDYADSCSAAIRKGIIINTIFCGGHAEGINTHWKHGADLADGQYINIDQDRVVRYIETPMDKEILRLNEKLNRTYIPYGSEGRNRKELQEVQDLKAEEMSQESMIQRSVSKSKSVYDSSSWDLVDALESGKIKIEDLENEKLPDDMKGMDTRQRSEHIEAMRRERGEVQAKISQLNDQREKYITEKKKEEADEDTLDSAVRKLIRQQAEKKNYNF